MLQTQFEIAPADKSSFTHARNIDVKDFEDAVVASLAHAAHRDFIGTRNVADFENSPVPTITPENMSGVSSPSAENCSRLLHSA